MTPATAQETATPFPVPLPCKCGWTERPLSVKRGGISYRRALQCRRCGRTAVAGFSDEHQIENWNRMMSP